MSPPPSEERLRHIVEQAQDLIYYCDPEGRFTYVNPAARLVLKYEPDELLGRPFLSIVREDYRRIPAGAPGFSSPARSLRYSIGSCIAPGNYFFRIFLLDSSPFPASNPRT